MKRLTKEGETTKGTVPILRRLFNASVNGDSPRASRRDSILFVALLFIALALMVLLMSGCGDSINSIELPSYVPDELLLRFVPGMTINEEIAFLNDRGITEFRPVSDGRTYCIKLRPGQTVEQAIAEFNAYPCIEYAEPNYGKHMEVGK